MMEHRFRRFFATEKELEAFRGNTVNSEVCINMHGHPTRFFYRLEAIKANLPQEMYVTHPFCLAYDAYVKRKNPRRFLEDDMMEEVKNSRYSLR